MSVVRTRRSNELRQLQAGGWSVQTYTPVDRLRAVLARRAARRAMWQAPVAPVWVSRWSR